MNRTATLAGALLAIVTVTVTGCGLQQEVDEGSLGTVTVYSPRPSAITDHIIDDFEEQSGYTVRLVTLGAAEVGDRVRAEAGNPQADVWWGGTTTLFEGAASEGLIEPWSEEILDRVPEQFHGSDSTWVAEMQQLQLIAYNSEMLSEEEAPADWSDLVDPRYAGQILIRDVAASGTMRSVYSALIYQYYAEDGVPDRGYEYLTQLDANTADYAANPEDLYLRLERQEAAITIWNHQDILAQAEEGAAFELIIPESGTPINLDGIARVAGGPNEEAAQAFAAYILSDETQTWLAENAFQIPTIDIEAAPEWLAGLEFEEFVVDRAVVAEFEGQWIDYWLENIKNQG